MPPEYEDVLLLRHYGLRPWETDGRVGPGWRVTPGYATVGHYLDFLAVLEAEEMAERTRNALETTTQPQLPTGPAG